MRRYEQKLGKIGVECSGQQTAQMESRDSSYLFFSVSEGNSP